MVEWAGWIVAALAAAVSIYVNLRKVRPEARQIETEAAENVSEAWKPLVEQYRQANEDMEGRFFALEKKCNDTKKTLEDEISLLRTSVRDSRQREFGMQNDNDGLKREIDRLRVEVIRLDNQVKDLLAKP